MYTVRNFHMLPARGWRATRARTFRRALLKRAPSRRAHICISMYVQTCKLQDMAAIYHPPKIFISKFNFQ